MSRPKRNFQADYSYHITVRCNNRDFNLAKKACREVFLYAIKQAQAKYHFKLYGLCIMFNHVHYLLEPAHPQDVPKIMHWLNWYTANTSRLSLFLDWYGSGKGKREKGKGKREKGKGLIFAMNN
jgi:REP element-mobilizing transposase RayT